MTEPLTKVDSAVSGFSSSPTSPITPKSAGHRRQSSSATGVFRIEDLEAEKKELKIAPETQRLNWKLNSSPAAIEEKDALKKMLTEPPVKKIDLHFPLGLEVTARNMKGVTIKDALDAIYKQYKKKADDEFDNRFLAGFEWDKEECWTRLIVHQKAHADGPSGGGKKGKKGKKGDDE